MRIIRSLGTILLFCFSGTLSFGQTTWRTAFGAFGPDEATCVALASNGDIIAAGSTGSFGNGSSDAYLLRVSAEGALIWSTPIGGGQIDKVEGLELLEDGSFVLVGYSNGGGAGGYDGWLVKVDPLGTIMWQRYFGSTEWDFLYAIERTGDGGYLLAGETYGSSDGSADGWLIRTDMDGVGQWTRTFGAMGDDELHSVKETSDGGIVVAGSITNTGSGRDVLVSKMDPTGQVLWERSYGTDSVEFARDVLETTDGGFSLVGTISAYTSFNEHLHLRLDADGDSLWSKHWGQINDQEATQHLQLTNGEYFTVGYTRTSGNGGKDMFIFHCTEQGDFITQRTFGGTEDDVARGLSTIEDGFVVVGRTRSYGAGLDDVFIVRTDSAGGTESETVTAAFDPVVVPTVQLTEQHQLYPNPATDQITLRTNSPVREARLFDAAGRVAREWPDGNGHGFDLSGVPPGVYRFSAVLAGSGRLSAPLLIHRP